MTSRTRQMVLSDLIAWRRSTTELAAEIRGIPWDSAEDVVTLTTADLRRALQRVLSGSASARELTEWAELLEAREDIGYERGSEDTLKLIVFEAANPSVNGPVHEQAVRGWIARLDERTGRT